MHPLAKLQFSKRVAKRAQYEALDISLCSDEVLVRNESHANPKDHEYTVTVEDGVPVACTCPADARFDGACKHRVAVAIRRPLLDALACQRAGEPLIVSDGGQPQPGAGDEVSSEETVGSGAKSATADETVEECDDCRPAFPCWECYKAGRVDLD
ncbi:SWIM zinc finger family protein [Haloarcula nitratireducens]|uniref:SWIM zinc finger domain-containing protein n=1 Tax=Haloarcula nitratireducens TaxID=2487749 RepID=A0AAW4PK03_9EURY|nr:SWIM zinc finger family protein [Halomicroarcula nitratireducens]MBX0298306.1 SWIM zinc finger domain-containing protein [Halomicroarcula nitratireducens]